MDRDKALAVCREAMEDGFDDFFIKKILKGRKPMLTDISHRSYPYTDVVKAYGAGVHIGAAIIIQLVSEGLLDLDDDT